jgi:hypothetical protein
MEKPTFTRACLSGVRVIMVFMHVSVIELLCQMVMGWPPVLKVPTVRCVWVPVAVSCHAKH